MRNSVAGVVVWGVLLGLAAASDAAAGEINMALFEHDTAGGGTGFGTLMLLTPDDPVDSVEGTIDNDRAVAFQPANDGGMHLGATWGLPSLDDVVSLVAGDWNLAMNSGGSTVSQASFTFDGQAADNASLVMPAAPTISGVSSDSAGTTISWHNNDPNTQMMIGGAIDWDASAALATNFPSDRETLLPALEPGDYEIIVGALTAGPEGVLGNFDAGSSSFSDPMLWTGGLASTSHTVSTAVPEPGSLAILGLAAVGLASRRPSRRRRSE